MTKDVITYTKDALALWNNSNGMPILAYIRTYESREFNLLDCYEIGVTFANDLLREKKLIPIHHHILLEEKSKKQGYRLK